MLLEIFTAILLHMNTQLFKFSLKTISGSQQVKKRRSTNNQSSCFGLNFFKSVLYFLAVQCTYMFWKKKSYSCKLGTSFGLSSLVVCCTKKKWLQSTLFALPLCIIVFIEFFIFRGWCQSWCLYWSRKIFVTLCLFKKQKSNCQKDLRWRGQY